MQTLKKHKFKKILLALFFTLVLFVLSILIFITIAYINTPLDTNKLTSTNLGIEIYNTAEQSTPIFYSSDKKIISSNYLQPHTVNAFIAIEDKRFYEHNGYDLKRIAKATLVNLKNQSKSQGASTITQQLVKNILLNSEKTYSRKFREIILAIKTEKQYTKEQILNMYLNSIYFGSNAYGIESASNLYFDKSASDLTINESACLAGIIKSPTYYSPINHPENAFSRKNIVLKQMLDNGFITLDEYNQNINEPLNISFKKNNYDNSYNQQVIIEACDLLGISEKELLRQELKIYTYLDDNIQQSLEDTLINSTFEGDKLSLVADNNGRVLAYFGDSYYNLSQMKRNPASTIKPLLIYLPAIATNTISPITPLLDEPIEGDYSPHNAGDKYSGWISARNALAQSSNVCAVRLLNELGLDIVNDYGFKLNLFNTYQSNQSIALGDIGGGIGIINLARSYSILQNNGVDKGLTFIDKIEDKTGKVLYQNNGYSSKVLQQEDCMLVNDMLVSCSKTGTAKRLSDLPFDVASKTGTAQINNKNTDLWNIAYTTEHLLLTWCGDGSSKGLEQNYSSSFYPTIINKRLLATIYSNYSPAPFNLNENIVKLGIDTIDYNTNHNVTLAPIDAYERYIMYDLFKVDNVPATESSAYLSPNFNLNVELTSTGAKISLETNPLFTYTVYSISNNQVNLIGTYLDTLYDDKVFKYQQVQYYVVATNKYTNKSYTSAKVQLNPQEYLVEMLNNAYVSRNRQTKNKWYV